MNGRIQWRRWAAGLNAGAALGLAAILAVLVNSLAGRYPARVDLSRARPFALTAETRDLLDRMPGELHLTAFLAASDDLFPAVQRLLREYAGASRRVRIESVDPHRDLARCKSLAALHGVREPAVIALEANGRRQIVPVSDLADYDYTPTLTGGAKVLRRFRGEQRLYAALQSLLEPGTSTVYVLAGHGERQADDFDPHAGYSIIFRQLERDALAVAPLTLEGVGGVPADAAALVVAGPTRRLPQAHVDAIQRYLEAHGRLFLLLDAGVETGLEKLLEQWGVRLGSDRVAGSAAAGWQVVVGQYGEHPVTAPLRNVTTVFTMPRPVLPLVPTNVASGRPADRPRVSVLASSGERSWIERSATQNPPQFDPGLDLPGPVPVAVAIEKGPERASEVELQPTRLVITGDSLLAANGPLLAGYPPDFFLSAVRWLLRREGPIRIAARDPAVIQLAMDRDQWRLVFHYVVLGIPALILALGLAVWLRRRR